MVSKVHGRCVRLESKSVTLINEEGSFDLTYQSALGDPQVGDIVEVSEGQLAVLTSNRHKNTKMTWMNSILDPRRRHAVKIRSLVEKGICQFFEDQGFTHVRTPLLVRSPGMDTHMRAYQISSGEFLPTSPEFEMKKLLAGGLEKIFQICPAFRFEPRSSQHHPEFTILEWYRAYAGYEEIMSDFENLVENLALKLFGKTEINFQGQEISVKAPWPRLKVRDLFLHFTEIDLVKENTIEKLGKRAQELGLTLDPKDTWDDLYFKIWLNCIENQLPKDKAVFVCRYPLSQSALSVIDSDSDGTLWSRRFEPYAGGLELGNAFEELTDPIEQRKRFIEDMNLRESLYGSSFPKYPIDEDFIDALEEGMPPSGGIAVGIDRLVMLFADEPDINYTLWLQSYVPPVIVGAILLVVSLPR